MILQALVKKTSGTCSQRGPQEPLRAWSNDRAAAHQKAMDTDQLLEQMDTVMFFHGEWHARARGSNRFAKGATAVEAMFNALLGL